MERETLEVDVLIVGGGPAGLSCAMHLNRLLKSGQGKEASLMVIEKGSDIGIHSLSGAIMDPKALAELFPDFKEKEAPVEKAVEAEKLLYLTSGGSFAIPFIPPPLENHGNYIISLSKLTGWLGEQAVSEGIDVMPGFAGVEPIIEDHKIVGVRTGDKGVDKEGKPRSNFEPGIDLRAKVTVLADGTRGNLTKILTKQLGLQGVNPQSYVTGIKEVWEVPGGRMERAIVLHTFGFPHDAKTYGGGFLYPMGSNLLSIGLMTGLDYSDPLLQPSHLFQQFKLHPAIKSLIEGGKCIQYGAKTVPVGGYYAMPSLVMDGAVIVGDAGSLFDSQRIKGVHLAIKSGMLAAEAIKEAIDKEDYSKSQLESYPRALKASYVGQELYKSRDFHQGFQKGRLMGVINAGLCLITGGRGLKDPSPAGEDWRHMKQVGEYYKGREKPPKEHKYDGTLTFDRLTSVYNSGTTHEEDQPCHLLIEDLNICHGKCIKEFENPCTRFCPAQVYEMEVDEKTGKAHLKLNPSNCVHCKTCDIKDPYDIITWVPPEGGGGPKYTLM